jgi:hypothetical protein
MKGRAIEGGMNMNEQHLRASIRWLIAALGGCVVGLASNLSEATEAGRNPFPSGFLGTQVGNLPPAGFYVDNDVVYFHADRFNDSNGRKAFPNFKLDVVGATPRLLWNSGAHLFGADVVMQVVPPPLLYGSVRNPPPSPFIPRLPPFGTDQRVAFGDLVLTPLLGWHSADLHVAAGVDFVVPTGAYNKNRLANPGMNTFTISPALAITSMAIASLELSTKITDDHYFRNNATGYTSGDSMIFEYTANYYFPTPVGQMAPGVGGYIFKQISDDRLLGSKFGDGFRGQAVSLGPELVYIHPSGALFEVRYQREFLVQNRVQGFRVFARAAIRF